MSNKVAYVTGGMGGIGTAICQRLHKDGFTVIAGCGPTRDYQKWLDEQKALGFTFYASVGNVAEWDSTVEAFSKAKAEHGPISVLVNNAGITRDRMFLKMTRDDWDAVLDTNLNSMFNVTKQVVADMVEKGWGRIINFASLQSRRAFANGIAYGASKGGVEQMTRAMAEAWSKDGINANAIGPGFIRTELTAAVFNDPDRAARNAAQTCIGRNGELSDLDGPMLFLCSEASAYVTGQVLMVDGGFTAK